MSFDSIHPVEVWSQIWGQFLAEGAPKWHRADYNMGYVIFLVEYVECSFQRVNVAQGDFREYPVRGTTTGRYSYSRARLRDFVCVYVCACTSEIRWSAILREF